MQRDALAVAPVGVGKGATRRATNSCLPEMVGTRSLSSGAHARDPLALPTLRRLPIGIFKQPRHTSAFSRRDFARVLHRTSALENKRAQGMPGAQQAPAASRAKVSKAHECRHYRYAETIRHSLRDGLRLISCSPRCAGLDSHRRRRNDFRQLDTSVGVSGPHDFAVRIGIARLATPTRPSHPAPNVRGERAYAPLGGTGRPELSAPDLPDGASEILSQEGWTRFS